MENIQSYNNEKYVSAEKVGHSSLHNFFLGLEVFFYFVVTIIYGTFQIIFNAIFKRTPPKDIAGQIALVTGGGNGFGREICFSLAREKCQIAVADINLKAAENTAEDIRENMGVNAKAYKVDVSVYDDVVNLHKMIKDEMGCVDILVNNAGLIPLLSFREGTPDDIQTIVNINVMSHFWTNRVFLKDMYERGRGHIVAISSVYGLLGGGRAVTYCTTKFAVRGFMDSLCDEIELNGMSDKIKTTCIFPTFMPTRQDLIETLKNLGMHKRVVLVSPDFAANETVKAIKNNTIISSIPKGLIIFTMIAEVLPRAMRNLLTEFVTGGKIPPLIQDEGKKSF